MAAEGVVAWQLLDRDDRPVEPVQVFLRELAARDASPATMRSYAFDLLRWWRFLDAVGVAWDKASAAEVRDLVLWLGRARKPIAAARTSSKATAGTTNPVTGKPYPGDGYAARTIRHSNAVLRGFYEFWIAEGGGPLVNPVPRERGPQGARARAHHNPLEPFTPAGRLRYNPRLPKRAPRAMPDAAWDELFAALRSDRDRAILALAISTGARAGELLGIRGGDIDWSEQLVRVIRKGSRAEQWLPGSTDAFVWLRLYLDRFEALLPSDPVWQTLRRRRAPAPATASVQARGETHRPVVGARRPTPSTPLAAGSDAGVNAGREVEAPTASAASASAASVGAGRAMSYEALRAVLRRANALLGANWSMHDLRHTAALRMVRDGRLSLRDAQVILGHAHLATTAVYLHEDDDAVIARVREHLAREHPDQSAAPMLVLSDTPTVPPSRQPGPVEACLPCSGSSGLPMPSGTRATYDPADLAVLFARTGPGSGR